MAKYDRHSEEEIIHALQRKQATDPRHPYMTDMEIYKKVGSGKAQHEALQHLVSSHVLIEEVPVEGYGSAQTHAVFLMNWEMSKKDLKKILEE